MGWTLAALGAAALVAHYSGREHIQVARIQAQEACRREFACHLFAAQHGGLYEPLVPGRLPEPLLTHVADRDLTAVSGQKLTLVNPAHTMEFALRRAPGKDTNRVHLIGSRPLRPANAPDPWEAQALRRLEQGKLEVGEEVSVDGHSSLRFLSRLTMQPDCLMCHEQQGFHTGDVCGGLSVTVPLEFHSGAVLRHERATSACLAVFWILGLLGLRRGGRELHLQLQAREAVHARLQESERRFRALAEQAPVGIYETDATGQFTYVNQLWRDMSGLSTAAIGHQHWEQSLHPEDRAAVLEPRLEHLRTGQQWSGDYRAGRPGGKVTWIHDSAVALRDAANRITGYLGVTTDLTETRLAAESLRESEERFRLAFESGPLGMVLLDTEGRFLQLNRAFADMLSYQHAELEQRSLAEFSHPEDWPENEELLHRSRTAPGASFSLELRYRRKDGATVWANVTTVFLQRTNGQALGHLAMIQDTTERRQGESQLREQAALLDISQDAICVQSLAGQIEFWNPAAEKLYGWTRAEALGANSDDLLFGRISQELLQARTDVLTQGSWSGELVQSARDGSLIPVQSRFSLVCDAQGQPKSILLVSTDLTAKKKLEQQFLHAQRLECIGALASGVAHDLNNVFSPILMVAELLASRPVDAADAELLTLLRTSADRGAGIVRQLLTFSRGQEIERVELHVGLLLKEMHRLARETFPKNIQLIVRTDPDLWPVLGDATQIHQMLLNLCVNARDAMPEGGTLTLDARNFRADPAFCQSNVDARPGPYVMLQVTDTGVGIPAAIRDKIFEPFFTTKPSGQGTGLGLPTVLSLVKAHRGFLDSHSQPGEGTQFRMFLPALEIGTGPGQPAPASGAFAGQGDCVLVVDDEMTICLVAKQLLTSHGYVPLLALDGVEAISLFTKHQAEIRFVLTDMMMPGMDGASFIRAVRKLAPNVPIVVMTGLSAQHFEADLAGHKRISFLAKPFTAEALLRTLQAFPTSTPPCPVPPELAAARPAASAHDAPALP